MPGVLYSIIWDWLHAKGAKYELGAKPEPPPGGCLFWTPGGLIILYLNVKPQTENYLPWVKARDSLGTCVTPPGVGGF